jgi:DNA adenine methylase
MLPYCGGKARIGKEIADVLSTICESSKCTDYFEPFCGALGVMRHMVDKGYNCYASDANEDLILLLNSIKSGKFKIPPKVSKKEYLEYKEKKHSAERGYVGICYSYAGTFFGSYYTKKSDGTDLIGKNNRRLKSMIPTIKKIKKISHGSYEIYNPKGFLIYCDPPYVNTQQKYSRKNFDSDKFWNIMRKWSKHNIVVVSETEAPKDFICIWEKEIYSGISKLTNSYRVEKLFVHKTRRGK